MYIYILARGPSLSTETDVYRPQILTYENSPRAERVNYVALHGGGGDLDPPC